MAEGKAQECLEVIIHAWDMRHLSDLEQKEHRPLLPANKTNGDDL